jgi:hypothetical protein
MINDAASKYKRLVANRPIFINWHLCSMNRRNDGTGENGRAINNLFFGFPN